MPYTELELDKILCYLGEHVYSKDEAIELIISILLGDAKIHHSFKWDRDYMRDFELFKGRVEQHIGLMLQFRRNRSETLEWLFKAADQARESIENVKEYLRLCQQKEVKASEQS